MGLDHPTTTTSMDHVRNVGHACHTARLRGVSKLIERRNITGGAAADVFITATVIFTGEGKTGRNTMLGLIAAA